MNPGSNPNEHKIILFDTRAWLSNSKLRLAPYTIKGVWIDLMSHMAQSERHGYLIVAGNPLTKDEIRNLLNFKKEEEFEKVWDLLVNKYKILKFDKVTGAYFSSRMVADYNKHHLSIHYEIPASAKQLVEIEEVTPEPAPVKKEPILAHSQNVAPKNFVAPTLSQIRELFTQIKKEEGARATYDIEIVSKEFYKEYSEKNWVVRKLPPVNMKEECRKYVFKSFVQDKELSMFEAARKAYPGMKNGLLYEFQNFKKKKDYKQYLPLLLPAIEEQKKWRIQMKQIKGQFVPEWKFFTTWINQQCWDQEMPKPENAASGGEGPIRAK